MLARALPIRAPRPVLCRAQVEAARIAVGLAGLICIFIGLGWWLGSEAK